MTDVANPLPVPGLFPEPINGEQYQAFTPEKFELWKGFLFAPADMPEPRLDLLALLLVNCGLVEAVRLAPRDLWIEALEQAYGSG